MTLREILHAHLPVLTEESTVKDAVDKMDIYQFAALVIVDREKSPIGVITEGDICRAATQRDSLTAIGNDPAIVYASKDPTIAQPDLEIGSAYHLMLSSGLTILPIVEDERLLGVTLRVDLMQAMLMDLEQDRTA